MTERPTVYQVYQQLLAEGHKANRESILVAARWIVNDGIPKDEAVTWATGGPLPQKLR